MVLKHLEDIFNILMKEKIYSNLKIFFENFFKIRGVKSVNLSDPLGKKK